MGSSCPTSHRLLFKLSLDNAQGGVLKCELLKPVNHRRFEKGCSRVLRQSLFVRFGACPLLAGPAVSSQCPPCPILEPSNRYPLALQ